MKELRDRLNDIKPRGKLTYPDAWAGTKSHSRPRLPADSWQTRPLARCRCSKIQGLRVISHSSESIARHTSSVTWFHDQRTSRASSARESKPARSVGISRISACRWVSGCSLQISHLSSTPGDVKRLRSAAHAIWLIVLRKRFSEMAKNTAPITASATNCGHTTSMPAPRNRTASPSVTK